MKIERTTQGLRDALFQTLDSYNNGEVDAAHVSTVTKTVNAILATVNTDLNAAKTMAFIKNSGGGDADFNLRLGSSISVVSEEKTNPDIKTTKDGYIHKLRK